MGRNLSHMLFPCNDIYTDICKIHINKFFPKEYFCCFVSFLPCRCMFKCLRFDHFSFHSGFGALNIESRWPKLKPRLLLGGQPRGEKLICLSVADWLQMTCQVKDGGNCTQEATANGFRTLPIFICVHGFWHTPLNGVSSLPRGQSSAVKEAKAVIMVL